MFMSYFEEKNALVINEYVWHSIVIKAGMKKK